MQTTNQSNPVNNKKKGLGRLMHTVQVSKLLTSGNMHRSLIYTRQSFLSVRLQKSC